MLAEKRAKKYTFWKFFEEICAIPHGSGNIKEISEYLASFAKERNLKYVKERCGNVIIYSPATEGRENEAPVILQGHMDMVAVKADGCKKNMKEDGLELFVKKGLLGAKDTSLGGDDGIALAYALAIMDSTTISHPAIEAVFTVDEEVGMDGAIALDPEKLHSSVMINIDNEKEGELITGCAGGASVHCEIPVEWKSRSANAYELKVSGLKGGHSGADINNNRISAVTIIARFLAQLKLVRTRIMEIEIGEKENVIAKSGSIKFICSAPKPDVIDTITFYADVLKEEFAIKEPDLKFDFNVIGENIEVTALHKEDSERVMDFLLALPQGIEAMSGGIKGLVETSDNIGVVSLKKECLSADVLVRSSSESAKQALCDKVIAVCDLAGGTAEQCREYPGWEYRAESPLRDHAVKVYTEMFEKEPELNLIHAGLECGIFADKLPNIDCISIGPDIHDIHTINERLDIASAERVFDYLTMILASEIKGEEAKQ